MPPARVELTLANYLLHTGYKSAVLPLNYRGKIEFVSSATIVIDTIHLICIKPGPGLGTSLGILVQLATNLQESSDPPGVEPVPFYYQGSSNLPTIA